MTTMNRIDQIQQLRLQECFGEAGTNLIIQHLDELDVTFGNASKIILQVMQGNYSKAKMDKDN